MNTNVTVSSVWTGPSGEQLTNSSHITVMDMLHSSPYTSVVVFDQVDDTDSGDYQCNITVSPADNNTMVLTSMSSATSYLNITGKVQVIALSSFFIPMAQFLTGVTTTNFGSAMAGQHFSLFCNISMANALAYSFKWLRLDGGSMAVPDKTSGSRVTVSGSLNSSTLEFNPLRTSDGGQYQCVATVMSGGAAVNITDEINLNVSSKWIFFSPSHTNTLRYNAVLLILQSPSATLH